MEYQLKMKNTLEDIANKLTKQIKLISENIHDFQEMDNIQQEPSMESYKHLSKLQQLQIQETYFDQLYETYCRSEKILESEKEFKQLLEEFQFRTEVYFMECQNKKGMIQQKLNDLMKQMETNERRVKGFRYTNEYIKQNVKPYCFGDDKESKTDNNEKTPEDIEINLRHKMVKNFLSKNEMLMIENEIGRKIEFKTFDSNINDWKLHWTRFYALTKNLSHLVIVIETTEGKKFGCYINAELDAGLKYQNDSEAFIFKFNNNKIEKYPIKDQENAIRVYHYRDDNLFSVGKNDIVIKKEEKRKKCSCKQTSFEYNGNENVLIGKKGNFEVKQFASFVTIRDESLTKLLETEQKYFKQLEEWTSLKTSAVVYDTYYDSWDRYTCELNDRIIGRKNIVFLIETYEQDIFGYYENTTIELIDYEKWHSTDKNSFLFSLESNCRLDKPMKFEVTKPVCGYSLSDKDHPFGLIAFCGLCLFKEEGRIENCYSEEAAYCNFKGLTKVLCANQPNEDGEVLFTLKRMRVIQMI